MALADLLAATTITYPVWFVLRLREVKQTCLNNVQVIRLQQLFVELESPFTTMCPAPPSVFAEFIVAKLPQKEIVDWTLYKIKDFRVLRYKPTPLIFQTNARLTDWGRNVATCHFRYPAPNLEHPWHFVGVRWIHFNPDLKSVNNDGLFGNRQTSDNLNDLADPSDAKIWISFGYPSEYLREPLTNYRAISAHGFVRESLRAAIVPRTSALSTEATSPNTACQPAFSIWTSTPCAAE